MILLLNLRAFLSETIQISIGILVMEHLLKEKVKLSMYFLMEASSMFALESMIHKQDVMTSLART